SRTKGSSLVRATIFDEMTVRDPQESVSPSAIRGRIIRVGSGQTQRLLGFALSMRQKTRVRLQ
ncbi:MAG: hypothetical protein NZ481_09595, partial [Candidatus Kapabacteria bacterium]|nr:hypothetical protein [Candidatus Kapabacteria bacterium]